MNTNSEEIEKSALGKLYLVSTPIGNLEDISYRAVSVLNSVDHILAEDTRKSKILLSHYKIATACSSYHDHNKTKVTPVLVERLVGGEDMALITDAGTPGISDPAFFLVREALKQNVQIHAIPGPTALISALVVSGLPTDRFVFEGFLPVKKGRKKRLEALIHEPELLFFTNPPIVF
ncbi:MAG: 16S rRNA (cytidine(1402)-2'-O)-methyltransferase [candidate division KSB1 bacterium]|nr:16S rRNA (cytidine(1402)-2'-O)-methyltransferase [candidate division KSB1 bacterium]